MNCICILKSITLDRIKKNYQDEVSFTNVETIEQLRYNLSMSNYDFAILDYNNYNYHELNSYLEEKELDVYIFNGKFDELDNYIKKELDSRVIEEKNIEKEIQIVEKYIEVEKKVEVEKIIEIEKEVEVEKIIEKRIYNKVKIVVASQKKGIGCTHYCFAIANHLKNKNYNVAIAEIGTNKLNEVKKNKIDILQFNTIDEYYSDKEIRKYDYVVVDLGYYERDNFKELFLSSDFKIVILGSKEWERDNMKYFFKYIGDMKIIKDLYYIFNFASDSQFDYLSNDMYGLKTYQGTYSDYTEINKDMETLIDNILNTYLEVDNKKLNFNTMLISFIAIVAIVLMVLMY